MQHQLHILIADSDSAEVQRFQDFVQTTGLAYALRSADSVAQVQDSLQAGTCDLLITEYAFADGTVFDILNMTPQPLTIVLTGAGSERTAVDTLQGGAADYIIKNADNSHLQSIPASVQRALESRARDSRFKTLTHAVMSINDSVFITDMEDKVIFVNKAFCTTYGYEKHEVKGHPVSLFWKDRGHDSTAKQDGGQAEDVTNLRSDGTEFPVSLTRSIVHDDSGNAIAVVGVAREITERIQAEQQLKASLTEKEVLLREIHHRVKNNLQIISSLLNLQAGSIHDAQTSEALRDSQNRVKSMALIHERLYRSETLTKVDFAAYVQSLVEHVRSSFRDTGGLDIRVQEATLLVDVDLAVSCGLIVNELLTNAIKHAFPGTRQGEIHILLHTSPTADAAGANGSGEMFLQVRDTGVGLPPNLEPDKVQTLGLQLISMLTQQLKGSISFTHEDGAVCTVRVPLP